MNVLIPPRVKVGGYVYAVEMRSPRDIGKGSDCYGATIHDAQQILIDNDLAPDMTAETFIHETLHAALYQAGFKDEIDCPQEELVARLGPMLYQIVKDNALFAP